MTRLNKLNGWQRLWFTGTILSLIIFGLFYPLIDSGNRRSFTYRSVIGKDYSNPACLRFIEQPFEQLQEPPYGDDGTCWHIYTTRKYSEKHNIPGTYAEWISEDNWKYVKNTLAVSIAIMITVVLLVSSIIYGLGKITAWIIQGFGKAR